MAGQGLDSRSRGHKSPRCGVCLCDGMTRGTVDEEAEMFRSLYPGLRRLAGACGPIDGEPEDLVQEAVSRALRRGPLTELDDAGAYLRRSIVNLASNQRRGQF